MTRPSWQDFGTHDESIVPELWDGVVGAWAPCLGPTGSRLHDMSRRNNWGTLTNMDPASNWVVIDGQYALDLDGSNDAIEIPSSTALEMVQSDITLSCWFNSTGRNNLFRVLMSKFAGTNTPQYEYGISTSASNNVLYWYQNNSNGVVAKFGTTAIQQNRVYHAVVTFRRTNNTGEIYLNGRLETLMTGLVTITSSSGSLRIGYDSPSGADEASYFQGPIWENCVWNRALSRNEIIALYQLGRGGMYQRRRRSRIYLPQAGFQAAWARRQSQIIGGGL